jgi:two-component system, NarL family, invasion response regulator UvrY
VVRILIVDDHMVVREGLRGFLADTPDLWITGEASNAKEALSQIRAGEWDLVLLDISMPDQNGLITLKQIKRLRPDLPVLIFSMLSEEEHAISSLEAGASGFVSKDSTPEQIREAIRRAVRGGKYVGPRLAERLLTQTLPQRSQLPHERLTPRELDIMLRIARGKALTQIGRELHLSVKTISTHRARILQKMELATNADLTRYVISHQLQQ